jgi:hypothetical protein
MLIVMKKGIEKIDVPSWAGNQRPFKCGATKHLQADCPEAVWNRKRKGFTSFSFTFDYACVFAT